MKRIIIDATVLAAIAQEIEHNCSMLNLSDEESAADDISFYVPRIQNAVYTLRETIKKAEPAESVKQ